MLLSPVTESQKKAHKNYLETFHEFKVRLDPDLYEKIKSHVDPIRQKQKEDGIKNPKFLYSINKYILEAIAEKLDRESE